MFSMQILSLGGLFLLFGLLFGLLNALSIPNINEKKLLVEDIMLEHRAPAKAKPKPKQGSKPKPTLKAPSKPTSKVGAKPTTAKPTTQPGQKTPTTKPKASPKTTPKSTLSAKRKWPKLKVAYPTKTIDLCYSWTTYEHQEDPGDDNIVARGLKFVATPQITPAPTAPPSSSRCACTRQARHSHIITGLCIKKFMEYSPEVPGLGDFFINYYKEKFDKKTIAGRKSKPSYGGATTRTSLHELVFDALGTTKNKGALIISYDPINKEHQRSVTFGKVTDCFASDVFEYMNHPEVKKCMQQNIKNAGIELSNAGQLTGQTTPDLTTL
ncbi:hypothetical protein K458DRAFT_400124 [Lentithecium fluviatile CBS 122367]|uniref:Uncharacterized protein n=1 Tax=Lentithecium fluviatile CBS 122367 TaxID=1168545 RepID=A0A6G1JFM4_9PLEO|nr:hypothetical protein K458DRAFT_400124 [Lentithecium fluviatile CBS 122367]